MKYGKALLKDSMLLNITMYIIWVYNQGFKGALAIRRIFSLMDRVHDNSSKDTSSNTTISLQRQLVYYDSLSNATLSLLLFLPTTSGRKI